MNATNADRQETDNMESLKQQASACGAGCACHAAGASSRMRWVIGAFVMAAVVVLVARALIKTDGASNQAQPAAPAFATAKVTGETPAAAAVSPSSSRTEEPATVTSTATEAPPAPAAPPTTKAAETSVGKNIGSISELNTVAASSDAVFVFLPGKEGASGTAPTAQIQSAARTLEAQGKKIGIFTLKTGSRDYDQFATQMAVPGVIAMVKGRGMRAVSGDITETKLIQGFVAASSAGGCGPSAGAGCCPK